MNLLSAMLILLFMPGPVWRVYKMTGTRGAARSAFSLPLFPKADDQFHLVG